MPNAAAVMTQIESELTDLEETWGVETPDMATDLGELAWTITIR